MKKILTAVLTLGLCLGLTACGESMAKPTEPTQTEPLWALAPEERPTETPTAPQLTEATEAVTETTAPAEPPETQAIDFVAETAADPTEETTAAEKNAPAGKTPSADIQMEEKFEPAEGILYAKKGVNVREQANVNCGILKKLAKGDEVQRVGSSKDGWTAIYIEDRVAYVSTDYLIGERPEPDPDPNVVVEQEMDDQVYTNHGVNMREGPGMDQIILCKIPEYTELHRIAGTTSGWYKVEYKDKVGWVNEAYIMPKYVDSEEHPQETIVNDTVYTTREVNLRKGPGTDKEILGRIPEGAQVSRRATTSNEWSKVTYKDQEGYISSKYVSKDAPADGAAG